MSTYPIAEGEVFEGPSKTLTYAHFLMFSGVAGMLVRALRA